jgi:hypothetical protein
MCGLCGALGNSQFWTDAAGHADFQRNGSTLTRRQEREQLVGLVNRVLQGSSLALRDWGGNSYVIEGPRGKLDSVYNIGGIWAAIDRITPGEEIDPLDEALLERLEQLPAT